MLSVKRTIIAFLAALTVIGATAELIAVSQPVKHSAETGIDTNELYDPPTKDE